MFSVSKFKHSHYFDRIRIVSDYSMEKLGNNHLETIRARAKTSHIHRSYQLIGFEIAVILKDLAHKSLYMKLAKEHNADRLLALAKRVAEKKEVQNKGGYFMRVMKEEFKSNKKS